MAWAGKACDGQCCRPVVVIAIRDTHHNRRGNDPKGMEVRRGWRWGFRAVRQTIVVKTRAVSTYPSHGASVGIHCTTQVA